MSVPADCVSFADYERYFLQRVDRGVAAYVSGTAADGITERENRAAFDRLRLMPRALVPMAGASAATTLLGRDMAYPIIIAPMAHHRLVHPLGELETVRAAGLARCWMTVSTQSSTRLEDVAAQATHPLLFQIYTQPRPQDTLTLIRRAEDAGYAALVLTVDAPINGVRNHEQRAGFRLPPGVSSVNLADFPADDFIPPQPGSPVFQGLLRHAPTWDDVAWLCRQTRLPVLFKGILNPLDVDLALAAGAAGLIVSNHGGRTLDTVPAALDMLPLVVEKVAGRVPVLVDGGIRRGTDIVKAIALGARAVMVGRPILHALAVGGLPGIAHLLTMLQAELEAAMALTGCPVLAAIGPGTVWPG